MSRERRLLGIWGVAVFGLAVKALATGLLPAPAGATVVPVAIDINRASVAELTVLPGIGRTRAEAIVLHRVRHGPFSDLEKLIGVDGCGEGTVEQLRGFAVVAPDAVGCAAVRPRGR